MQHDLDPSSHLFSHVTKDLDLMKFIYRSLVAGLVVVTLLLYLCFSHLTTPPHPDHLPYISDKFGEECLFNDTIYQEGQIFFLPCQECYCSFGTVECAVVHCRHIKNTLGMELIVRSVQVLIPTVVGEFPGTIAVMNSVLRNTKHKVKFTIVLFQVGDDPLHANHLRNWIEGTGLRLADYVITRPSGDDIQEWVGINNNFVRDYWTRYQKMKQQYELKLKNEGKDLGGSHKTGSSSSIKSPSGTAMLMLNTLLPREHRVVVLSNHVVVKGDISDLFNANMEGKPVAATKTCHSQLRSNSTRFKDVFKPSLLADYGIPEGECLFSPGVIVADLDNWFSAETESQLSSILREVLEGEVLKEEEEVEEEKVISQEMSFAPFLLNFWNKSRDLSTVWSVRHMGNAECTGSVGVSGVLEGVKVLDWGFQRPWECRNYSMWRNYFLKDPTGMFRLNSYNHADL